MPGGLLNGQLQGRLKAYTRFTGKPALSPLCYHAPGVSNLAFKSLVCFRSEVMASGLSCGPTRKHRQGQAAGFLTPRQQRKTRFSPLSENREISARKSGLA
jgi:hypothetical protein